MQILHFQLKSHKMPFMFLESVFLQQCWRSSTFSHRLSALNPSKKARLPEDVFKNFFYPLQLRAVPYKKVWFPFLWVFTGSL